MLQDIGPGGANEPCLGGSRIREMRFPKHVFGENLLSAYVAAAGFGGTGAASWPRQTESRRSSLDKTATREMMSSRQLSAVLQI